MHQHAGYARRAFRAGAQGYLTKHADPDDMLAALRKVAQGRQVLSPDMAELLANDSLEADAAISRLTPRNSTSCAWRWPASRRRALPSSCT